MGAIKKFAGPPWTDRRVHAAELLDEGHGIKTVAERLGLSPVAARKYLAIFKAGGKSALMGLGDVGPRRKLSSEGLSWLDAAVKHSPTLHGFPGSHWTTDAISELIERQFQIQYSRSRINALMREFGLQDRVRQRRRRRRTKTAGVL